MESKGDLYVLVSSYPYGHAVPFLESELKHIHNKFDKIYVVMTDFEKLCIAIKRFWVQRDYTTPKPIFKMLSVGSLVPKKNHEYLNTSCQNPKIKRICLRS